MTAQLEQDVKLAESVGLTELAHFASYHNQLHTLCNAIREQAVPDGYVVVKKESILACRDALVLNDVQEAYHQLYHCKEWDDRYKPWNEIEHTLPAAPTREEE